MISEATVSLPFRYRIDYRSLCRAAARTNFLWDLIAEMRSRFPAQWQRVYAAAVAHRPNIVRVEYGTFDYICDSYSGVEALGEVAFDQRVRDRVVGVLGVSLPLRGCRRRASPDWVEHPGEVDSRPGQGTFHGPRDWWRARYERLLAGTRAEPRNLRARQAVPTHGEILL